MDVEIISIFPINYVVWIANSLYDCRYAKN